MTLRSQFDLQMNEKIAIEIKMALGKAEERNGRLEGELRQGRENLESKNHEIQVLMGQQEQLLREMRVLE